MSQITLFGSRLSPFVEKVARALQLKRLGFREVDVKSPFDLRRWNPTTGKMPVLELDGERIYDSTFILRRLDEVEPEPPLFAEDPAIAAAQRLLEDWSDESLYWYLMALRWAKPNAAATIEQITGSVPSLLRPLVAPLIARQIGSTSRPSGSKLDTLIRVARQSTLWVDSTLCVPSSRMVCLSGCHTKPTIRVNRRQTKLVFFLGTAPTIRP